MQKEVLKEEKITTFWKEWEDSTHYKKHSLW